MGHAEKPVLSREKPASPYREAAFFLQGYLFACLAVLFAFFISLQTHLNDDSVRCLALCYYLKDVCVTCPATGRTVTICAHTCTHKTEIHSIHRNIIDSGK
jgi:hypothetical protein